jgi:protein-tyrosine phosphatase
MGAVALTQTAGQAEGVRRIEIAGVANFRDVGGYPAAGGRTVRWRRLFRSDAPHRLDADGMAILSTFQLRSVLDLRTPAETELAPSPLDRLAARTTRISLLGSDLESLPVELDAIYRFLIDERGDAIGEAVRVLCRPGAMPALVHCSAGKDRTGIVIALVLAALGVPDGLIMADYALSASYLELDQTPVIGELAATAGLDEQQAAALLASPAQLIAMVLDRVRTSAGSVDGYLTEHGVSGAELANLRAALSG